MRQIPDEITSEMLEAKDMEELHVLLADLDFTVAEIQGKIDAAVTARTADRAWLTRATIKLRYLKTARATIRRKIDLVRHREKIGYKQDRAARFMEAAYDVLGEEKFREILGQAEV